MVKAVGDGKRPSRSVPRETLTVGDGNLFLLPSPPREVAATVSMGAEGARIVDNTCLAKCVAPPAGMGTPKRVGSCECQEMHSRRGTCPQERS